MTDSMKPTLRDPASRDAPLIHGELGRIDGFRFILAGRATVETLRTVVAESPDRVASPAGLLRLFPGLGKGRRGG